MFVFHIYNCNFNIKFQKILGQFSEKELSKKFGFCSPIGSRDTGSQTFCDRKTQSPPTPIVFQRRSWGKKSSLQMTSNFSHYQSHRTFVHNFIQILQRKCSYPKNMMQQSLSEAGIVV